MKEDKEMLEWCDQIRSILQQHGQDARATMKKSANPFSGEIRKSEIANRYQSFLSSLAPRKADLAKVFTAKSPKTPP
jgi:hypothetical protein